MDLTRRHVNDYVCELRGRILSNEDKFDRQFAAAEGEIPDACYSTIV